MSWWNDVKDWIPFIGGTASSAASIWGQREANAANIGIARETNAANRDIARETNAANAKQISDLMKWQENMSNTSYQRSMADMKKAGINPMLAGINGGASTPPGASMPAVVGAGAVTGAPMQSNTAGLPAAVNSAIDAMRLRADMKLINENVKNAVETNRKIRSDATLNAALTRSAAKDAELKSNSAKVAAINAKLLENQLPGSAVEAALDQTEYGMFMRTMGRANPLTSQASSAAGAARDLSHATRMSGSFGNSGKRYYGPAKR